MVDLQTTVCSMCGDLGFPDKLFRCIKCHNRFQHSYCSNYYSEASEPIRVCDWCQSDRQTTMNGKHGGSGGLGGGSVKKGLNTGSEYSGSDKIIKNIDREDGATTPTTPTTERGKNPTSGGGAPSPRQATRRYKLLKDVMC